MIRRSLTLIAILATGCSTKAPPTPVIVVVPVQEHGPFNNCNVVFISLDALQASHLGSYGYTRAVSPNLDAFAKNCHRFERVSSVASWTVPSSMSWFTGVYPSEHRVTNKFAVYTKDLKKKADLRELSPNLVTLADVFRENGYATAGFTGNAGVSGGFGYEQGFDVYEHEENKFGSFDFSIPKALAWVNTNKDRKFFLFLHGYDTHGQNTPAGNYDFRFVDKDYDGKFTGSALEQEILREEGLASGRVKIREADVRFWRAVYDEKIQRLDAKFQTVIDEFSRLGLMENTLFIVTSDHGTELHEHGRFDHGFTLYQEQIHVPLLIRTPRQSVGQVISPRVSSIDVMPTILELTGLNMPDRATKQLRGTSLSPVIRGQVPDRDSYFETDYRAYTYKRGVTTHDGWKMVLTLESKSQELYDLNADPGETKNLFEVNPERAKAIEKKIYDHFRSIGSDLQAREWRPGMNPVYNSQGREKQ